MTPETNVRLRTISEPFISCIVKLLRIVRGTSMDRAAMRATAVFVGISLYSSVAVSAMDPTGTWKCQSDNNVFGWSISPEGEGQPNTEKSKFSFTLNLVECSKYK